MATDTRTAPLVGKLVEGIQADIKDTVELLTAGLSKMRALEGHVVGVNGLASTLRGKGNEVQQVIEVLNAEAEAVAKKMLGRSNPTPTVFVNHELVSAVHAARGDE